MTASNLSAWAGSSSQVIEDNARFTVITPECVRLEYIPKNSSLAFVDEPTFFAASRDARFNGSKITHENGRLIIDTGRLRLEYHPDGKTFNSNNLVVYISGPANGSAATKTETWRPGQKNPGNLGGPLSTLDEIGGPQPLPDGLLSRDGWSLVDDSGKPLFVNGWAKQRRGGVNRADILSPSTAINRCVDWYLFAYGDDYKGAFASLKAISGPAAMPRKHVLGAWYCRWHPYTADEFRGIVDGFREHDFPLDILVMDMEWHTKNATVGYGHAGQLGWTGYSWNKKLIPDPAGLLADFKKDGISVSLNDHPADGVRDNEDCYAAFMNMLPKGTVDNPPFNSGDPRYMQAYFKAAHEPLEKQGVDFWWVDWQQDYLYPEVYGIPGLRQLPWLNQLYYQHSGENGRRGQGYSRWGGWGDQRHPIQFSGDAESSWKMLAFEIPFTLASANQGCFFWAHDTGGFWGARNPENFARWVQFCSLSAALRLHSSGEDRRPWLWGQPFEDSMRQSFHLRSQLFPYIYTSARQCYDDMTPLLRPLYLEYPDTDEAYAHPGEYFFGDNLIAAPIVTPGKGDKFVAGQTVWLPPGLWYNYFTGEAADGSATGKDITVSADINQIPLFVRAGAPLPMQPYTPRMATTPLGKLVLRIYPGHDGEAGSSALYEDDGQTSDYQAKGFARTKLSCVKNGDSMQINIAATDGRYAGQMSQRTYRIELAGTAQATAATINGQPAPASALSYDAAHALNVLEIPNTGIRQAISINVKLSAAGNPK